MSLGGAYLSFRENSDIIRESARARYNWTVAIIDYKSSRSNLFVWFLLLELWRDLRGGSWHHWHALKDRFQVVRNTQNPPYVLNPRSQADNMCNSMQTQIFPRIIPSVGLPILYLENDERFKFTQHDVSLNMANKNTLVDPIIVANLNQSPQLTKSPQMQNGNIQKINDDNRPSPEHKIYHFHNCRIMNSFNTRTITMENSGNKVPQVTICSSFFLLFSFMSSCNVVLSVHKVSGIEESDENLSLQPHAVSSNGTWILSTGISH